MSPSTRGPRPGKVPPHIQPRVERKHARAQARAGRGPWYRRPLFIGAVATLVALVAGIVIGRVTAPDPVGDHLDEAAAYIGIADAAELTWAFGLQSGAPSVKSARDTFERDGATVAATNLDQWLASYDQFLDQLAAGGDVEPAVDGVRRLVLASVEAARAATETLGAAAATEGRAREALLTQVDLLRAQAQRLDFEARQLFAALGGDLEGGLPAPPSPGPSLPRPSPPPPSGAPTVSPSASPQASPSASPSDGASSPSGRASERSPEPTASGS